MINLNIDLFDIVWEQTDVLLVFLEDIILWIKFIVRMQYIYISLYLSICFLILLFFGGKLLFFLIRKNVGNDGYFWRKEKWIIYIIRSI